MTFTTRHEQELAEISSLTRRLDQRANQCLEELDRINDSLDAALRQTGSVGANRSEPLLAFVHIPKTAGGTVLSMFAAAYSKAGIRDSGNYFRNTETTPTKIARRAHRGGGVLAGHTPYGLLRAHLPPDARYMTFLREPVDRVISQYWRHIRLRNPNHAGGRRGRAGRVKQRQSKKLRAASLEQAYMELRLPEINNLATRFLCGDPAPLGDLPKTALDDAKENLSKFDFVGIQERFEESLVLLQRMLGLGSVPYQDRHVSSDRPSVDDLPDADRVLIEEHNQLDAELYRFGLKLFEEAVGAADDEEFAADVASIRELSAGANEESIRNAREWLERELPPGRTRLALELRMAAKAEGITVPALMQALATPSVTREPVDGKKAFTRLSERSGGEPGG
jgi:hypothetical protein